MSLLIDLFVGAATVGAFMTLVLGFTLYRVLDLVRKQRRAELAYRARLAEFRRATGAARLH